MEIKWLIFYVIKSYKSGSNLTYQKQFSSLQELNTHIEKWLAVHKHDFSKGALIGLKRLVRFSAKIPGVCNAKIGTILKAIHAEYSDHGISRSTFKRMIQKAKDLAYYRFMKQKEKMVHSLVTCIRLIAFLQMNYPKRKS